jgi:superfamily II DNA or RNA helicase
VTISARLTVHGLPPELTAWCLDENTFQNPMYYMLRAMHRPTRRVPRQYELARVTAAGDLTAPRGWKRELLHELHKRCVPFTVEDNTVCPSVGKHRASRVALCDYQQRAINRMIAQRYGVLQAPTGSGKTNVMLGLIDRLQTPVLILTHTHNIFDQTCKRISAELGIQPGRIIGTQFELRDVSVAMIQTLSRRDMEGLGITKHFGAVLADEIHHGAAFQWAKILNRLPARYRLGFTATAWRKDKLEFIIWRVVGRIIEKVTRAEAEAAGRIVWPERIEVPTAYTYGDEEGTGPWTAMLTDLTKNEERNRLVITTVRERLRADSKALVLTDRVWHAKALAALLFDLDPVLLTGSCDDLQQHSAMRRIRAGARLTVATVGMLGEGVDVPGWDMLFLATPFAGGPRTLQAIGRVTRPAPGKQRAQVFDFVDEQVDMLARAAGSRERLYKGAD